MNNYKITLNNGTVIFRRAASVKDIINDTVRIIEII